MPEFPDWTEFCSDESEHRGLDPLGLHAVGASIVQKQLLPGITNATLHIRYYSFFCWVFWKFWDKHGEKAHLREQKKWGKRLENVLRSATLDRNENIAGLIGVTKATRINGKSLRETVRIEGGNAATAFVPANYSSSFRALGCGRWDEKEGAKLTDFGISLARAFDEGIDSIRGSSSALTELCSNAPTVSVRAIRCVADAIRLRPVNPTEPEHKLLTELLLRMETADDRNNNEYDINRSRSLALFMEIAKQAHGTLSSTEELHRIFATGQLPNHQEFVVPPELHRSVEIWKRHQERQYITLSVYSLWHEVVQALTYETFKTATAQQLLSRLDELFEQSGIAQKWFGKGFAKQQIGEILRSFLKRFSFTAHDFGKRAIVLADDLINLNRSSEDRVGGAIVLLLLCTSYWKKNGDRLPEAYLHKQGGNERLSLETVCSDVEQLADCTVEEYLQWASEAYVLKQSTRVAMQKLPDYRFFIIRDDDGYRLIKPQDPRSYLSYDSSRINSAYKLIADLRLVDMDDGIKLSTAGRKVLEKLRKFHRSSVD